MTSFEQLALLLSVAMTFKSFPNSLIHHHLCQSSLDQGVLACKLGWHPSENRIFTTPAWPLLTATWSGLWRLLFRAFRSAPALISCSSTAGSSPNAAWWTARSPSLSCNFKGFKFISTEDCFPYNLEAHFFRILNHTKVIITLLYLCFQICLVSDQDFDDIFMTILTGSLESSVSSKHTIWLEKEKGGNSSRVFIGVVTPLGSVKCSEFGVLLERYKSTCGKDEISVTKLLKENHKNIEPAVLQMLH